MRSGCPLLELVILVGFFDVFEKAVIVVCLGDHSIMEKEVEIPLNCNSLYVPFIKCSSWSRGEPWMRVAQIQALSI